MFTEACLAAPQFYKNFVNKSTKGMSIGMVLMWTAGDLFKTVYFILRNSPTEFLVCGILQASLNLGVLLQVYVYKTGKRVVDKLEPVESDDEESNGVSNVAFIPDESESNLGDHTKDSHDSSENGSIKAEKTASSQTNNGKIDFLNMK